MSTFTYNSAFKLSESPFNPAIGSSSSSTAFVAASDDDTDDACSICLESFTLQDPATVTSCKHEYHLQCIIEWSQRSKECPICWQLFVLKDPVSQELLSAVEKERLMKTRNISSSSPRSIHHSHEDYHSDEEESQFSSFDEQFLRHLTEAAHMRCLLRRREAPISSSLVSSNDSTTNIDHISAIINTNPGLSPGLTTPSPASGHSSVPSPDSSNGTRIFPGRSPSSSSQSPDPSKASSLPEAIKSKLAAASAKYKESISKSKQGLKEKLLARNNSVKELSKGVQREMNAGLAGVARMIERFDLASKRFGGSAHVSTSTTTTTTSGFNFSFKGKRVEANPKSTNNGD
ncbi:unnamed protein product [Microthlaspi erraticum]|uniref:RING-type E3 ubiquitin transferase n=1 Tax=Microthlaspi erraticum TaxID=1685480 RepID=A0A6D2IGK1_9BRAS|nr:unnamed protein product [Microthlaspi erraticum]